MTVMEDVVQTSSSQSPVLTSQERPRQSAELVTKSIRSKLNPLEAQLHNARNLLDGTTNVFLPRKEEFILDWLLEKLKGDKKQTYPSHTFRRANFSGRRGKFKRIYGGCWLIYGEARAWTWFRRRVVFDDIILQGYCWIHCRI
jgi:hypothetical protein